MDYQLYLGAARNRVESKYPEADQSDLEALAHLEVQQTVQALLHFTAHHSNQQEKGSGFNLEKWDELTSISREAVANLHRLGETRVSLLERYSSNTST